MEPDEQIERVRRICLQFDGTTEKISWGEPTFRARGRTYAMYASANSHHGGGRSAIWCHAPIGAQPRLVESAPDRIFVPPYMGKAGWIGLWLDVVSEDELSVHLYQAYRTIGEE